MKKNNKIRVLITAIGGSGHGEQVLKALLQTRNSQYEIYGADCDSEVHQKNLVKKFFQLPKASHPDYLESLKKILVESDIKVLIHGCEPEMRIFAKNKFDLEKMGILVLINTPEVIELCSNKFETGKLLQKLGFDTPKNLEINSINSLEVIDWYPIIVKPKIESGGSNDVYICQNRRELESLFNYLKVENNNQRFMLQEYVGNSANEYTVGVLSNKNGDIIDSIAMKKRITNNLTTKSRVKNSTDRQDLGDYLVISSGVSQGDIGRFPVVTEQCEKIAVAIGSRGPLNIQCRLVGEKIFVYEINPRFSGTSSIRAMVGFNEPHILIQAHINPLNATTRIPYKEATVLRSLSENYL